MATTTTAATAPSSQASSQSSLYAGSAADAPVEPPRRLAGDIASSILDALSSEKLDRCIALQSRNSGNVHAQSLALGSLNSSAREGLVALKQDFADGIRLARTLKADLSDIQRRIALCEEKAKRRFPIEYHSVRDGLTQVDDEDEG